MTKDKIKPAAIEKFLSYRLSVLSRLINRKSTRHFATRYGLSLAEWRCLAQIGIGKACMIRDIAERTHSDKAQMSRAAMKLTKKGLIIRFENEADGRSAFYKISKEGKKLYDRILPLRAGENQMVLDVLSKTEQKQLIDFLDRIMLYLTEEEEDEE